MIAGKGHEQGQEFAGGRKVPFDDVDGRARGAARARRGARDEGLDAERVAEAAGARLAARRRAIAPPTPGPARARSTRATLGPGDLFVGLRGERVDGGRVRRRGARGGRLGRARARPSTPGRATRAAAGGVVLAADDPLRGAAARSRAPGGASCGAQA